MGLWDRTKPGSEISRTDSANRANRRAAERKRQRMIDGFIASARRPTQPCTICDMSSTGSKVELWNDDAKPFGFGDRVTLYIPGDRKEIDCEVRWRKAKAMGLRFTSAVRGSRRRLD
jgi:PilZ domain